MAKGKPKSRHKIVLSETLTMNSGLRAMDFRLRRAFPNVKDRMAYIDARLEAIETSLAFSN